VSEAVVPQNLEAERRVLGALLLAGASGPVAAASACSRVLEVGLSAEDFYYSGRHGQLFRAISAVANRGDPTDALIVEQELQRRGWLEDVGGTTYVRELAAIAPAVANVRHFAALVVDASRRRALLRASVRLAQEARNGGVSGETLTLV
jgi:replicative DNA helicase